ncbi:MAG: hypothetical protein K6F01_03055 [Selenomonas sp.]|uniref:alginate O-acetyltransferase AlgX-related protein n=1 Tax=Selenomonas sp. TaxID=2053611 RepID=UPI0025D1184A|nr:DHHW family protein [Selenomonas sp.]MCR5438410.1 hypothetical protein [Selenomonas sp.]
MSIRDYIMRFCAGLLVLAFFLIFIRWFTVVILIDNCKWDNTLTRLVLWDNWRLPERIHPREKDIDWASLYPFPEPQPERSLLAEVRQQENKLREEQERIANWSETYFPGYTNIVETGRRYDQFIGWNIRPLTIGSVQVLSDGWLFFPTLPFDLQEYIDETASLAEFCQQQGTKFLFVPNPPALDPTTDSAFTGRLDFGLQKKDAMLQGLQACGIATLDLYPYMHRDFPDTPYHQLFFRSDHHWLPTTGFWAATHIAQWLEDAGDISLPKDCLRLTNYRQEHYPAYFLGSQGKRMTTVLTQPDNFMLLYPEFPTCLHYEIPGLGIDTYGDFSITYDMHELERKDFYGSNPYAAYNHADCSLIRIENFAPEAANIKLLVIKDSFANSVAPFLALCVKQMDIIDPRWFKGSIHSYIHKTQPDFVLVLHTIDLDYPLERDSHQDNYDFR